MKSISRYITIAICATVAIIGLGLIISGPVFAEDNCTNVLSSSWCDKSDGEGIKELVMLIINILTAGLFVAATAGFIWCGMQIMTARDDPAQVAKARKRMIEIVIGLVAWIMSAVLINLILPGGDTSGKLGTGGVIITTKIQL